MHYDLVKNKEKGGKIALMSAITRGNGTCSTNGASVAFHLSRLNINNDFYVNAWRCAKCAQAECEKCDSVVNHERFKMYAISYTFFFICVV